MGRAVAEGKAAVLHDCRVHILDAVRGLRTENWIVGEHVTGEAYERFKDKSGNLYAVVAYEDGKPQMSLAQKSMWEQVARQFSDIDREASQAFDRFKRDFLS